MPRALVAGGDTPATSTGQSRWVGGRTRTKTKPFTVSHPVKNRGNKGLGSATPPYSHQDDKAVAAAAAAAAAATAAATAANAATKKLEGTMKHLLETKNDKAGGDQQQVLLKELELNMVKQHHSEVLKEKELRLADKDQYRKEMTDNFMTLISDQRKGSLDLVRAMQGKHKKRKRSDSGSDSN